jgi:tetratricopeptide (TPR) repeat protein
LLQKAVDLDPTSSDARVLLAWVKADEDFDWQGSEQEYRHAIQLNPNSAAAHDGLCFFYAEIGRPGEGWSECQVAQALDPDGDHLSQSMYARGERDRAIELLQRWSDVHPGGGYAHWTLHRWYAMKGMYKESIAHMEQGLELYGFGEISRQVHSAFERSGYKGAMREFAKDLEELYAKNEVFAPLTAAQAYAALGEKDRAFYWLNKAYEDRDRVGGDPGLVRLNIYPMLDPLRSDPRFKDLLRRIGLPP